MRYAVANLGEVEPSRYIPEGPTDCTDALEYRKAVDNAAERIAYYQQAMQQAVAAENYGAIDRAKAGVDEANHDWEVWSRALKKCETSAPAAAAEAPSKRSLGALLALGGIALITIVAVVRPKLDSITFWKAGRR